MLTNTLWTLLALAPAIQAQNWPGFRGPRAAGVEEGHETPVAWDVEKGEGVIWKRPVPGLAHSSPVVWGERLFLTSAVRVEGASELSSLYGSPGYGAGESVENEGEHAFVVLCLDKRTGELLWERTAHVGVPKVKRHPKSSHANSTPACDAERVVAFFGSEGLHCYDHEGRALWKLDLGVLDCGAPRHEGSEGLQWGFASSPVLEGGRVFVQCDVQGQSFVAAFDARDGKELWRKLRQEEPTWCTPTVCDGSKTGKPQLLVNGYEHIGGYDLESGEELWKLVGGGDVPVPTPVVAHGLVYLTSAHGRDRPLRALRVTADGLVVEDGESPHVAWSLPRGGIYMQTPLVYGEELYACSDGGVLGCYDARSGAELFRERLGAGGAGFSSSAVAGDGKLYFSAESGEVFVLRAGRSYELLARNELGETCMATPALSAGRLFFRTRTQLLALGEPFPERSPR